MTGADDVAPAALAEPVPALEFDIAPADVDRLLRLSAIASRRQGRAKSAAMQWIWHDTPAGDLAAQGLALAEQRGAWRLERLVPNGAADWLPATPAPILAEGASRLDFQPAMPAGLMPVAGFTGRQRHFALLDPTGAARLTVLEGALRGLAAEKPACRLILAGDPAGMAALACDIAADIPLVIPRSGLAADATALAQGRVPAARHLGGPAIPPGLTVDAGLILVLAHLADVILHWAPLTRPENGPVPVHQMRVAVRRLRSALSVFRRADAALGWRDLADALKTLAARLGAARDWDVFLAGTGAGVADAFRADPRIAGLLAAAGRKRQAAYAALADYFAGRDWQRLALDLALLPTRRAWAADASADHAALLLAPIQPFAAGALDRRLKHVLSLGEDFPSLTGTLLHDIRKQAKRLRYASEFFAALFPGKTTRRFLSRLEDVQEALGTVNDLSVAAALMAAVETGGKDRAFATGAVQGYVAACGRHDASSATQAWKKFIRAEPFWR